MLLSEVLQEGKRTELGRRNCFFFELFNEIAKQVEIIILIIGHPIFETGEHVSDFHSIFVVHFVVDRAGEKHAAKAYVVLGHCVKAVASMKFSRKPIFLVVFQ